MSTSRKNKQPQVLCSKSFCALGLVLFKSQTFSLETLVGEKEENLLNQCWSWQNVSSQDVQFPFLEHLECCCQLPSACRLHVDTLPSCKVRFTLHKTPVNSWNTLLEWREKDPIQPSPFRGFQGEKAQPPRSAPGSGVGTLEDTCEICLQRQRNVREKERARV